MLFSVKKYLQSAYLHCLSDVDRRFVVLQEKPCTILRRYQLNDTVTDEVRSIYRDSPPGIIRLLGAVTM